MPANAAVLTAAAMNPVTGDGAPWYTSGVHMWNGTAPTLNANPTSINASPPSSSPSSVSTRSARNDCTRSRLVVPVAP